MRRLVAMRVGVRSLHISVLLAAAVLTATPSWAFPSATAQFTAYLDLDNNSTTGCTVTTPDGPFPGVEELVTTTVDLTQTPPQVIAVNKQLCTNPGTNTFGPAQAITSPFAPPWQVGVGNGTGGADVVESYLPLPTLETGTTIHLAFTSLVVGGNG